MVLGEARRKGEPSGSAGMHLSVAPGLVGKGEILGGDVGGEDADSVVCVVEDIRAGQRNKHNRRLLESFGS